MPDRKIKLPDQGVFSSEVVSMFLFMVNGDHTNDTEARGLLATKYNQALQMFDGDHQLLKKSILEKMSNGVNDLGSHPEFRGQDLTKNPFVVETLDLLQDSQQN